jgi:hypothetical protein
MVPEIEYTHQNKKISPKKSKKENRFTKIRFIRSKDQKISGSTDRTHPSKKTAPRRAPLVWSTLFSDQA